MRYTVFLKQSNGQYTAVVPLLPACSVHGRTREEALRNVKIAIAETLADMEIATVEVDVPTPPAPSNPWLNQAAREWDRGPVRSSAFRLLRHAEA